MKKENLRPGCVVMARRGKDKGRYFCVLALDGNFCLLRDGKSRRLEKPKRKNVRHITVTPYKLKTDDLKVNAHLKKAIDSLAGLVDL